MHLLPCPQCQTEIQVAPSKAGGETVCPNCQTSVAIPKLGELKHLPLADVTPAAEPRRGPPAQSASGMQAGFVTLGLIATVSLLIAGFCSIRWYLIDASMSTEKHISEFQKAYVDLKPAELIREYEQMEEYGIDMPVPFKYKKIEDEKNGWGRKASIAGTVCGVSFLGAAILSATGRRKRS